MEKAVICAAYLVLANGYLIKEKKRNKRKRRYWMAALNKSRERYNGSDMLMDLTREPSGGFHNFCRTSSTDFEFLLNKIGPLISKKDTNMRAAIPVKERLAVTLRFLATGDSYQSLHYLFKFSAQLISSIIPEVCNALLEALKDCVKIPEASEDWEKIVDEYDKKWNFPHCCGALDGKHVVIQSPFKSGSEFFNYKGQFSVVLMGLVDANYCFTFADVGCQGRISDGGVFRNTVLFKRIEEDQLLLPLENPLPGRNTAVPYLFVSDDAFGLSSKMLKPYPGTYGKRSKERVFNYRLSRARRVVENTFGILSSVFRVLRKPILLKPEKASVVTMTCIVLHNFLKKSNTSRHTYAPDGTFDKEKNGTFVPGSWRNDTTDITSLIPIRRIARKSGLQAKEIRNEFAEYFTTTGQIPRQNQFC